MRKFFIPVLCAIVFLSASVVAFPQTSTQVTADKYYSTLNFAKAIPYYEALVKKSDTDVDPIVLARLADCYRMTNDLKKAAEAYNKLVALPNSKPIVRYYYAKALLSEGDANNAAGYFDLYNNDNRGEAFSKSIRNAAVYFKDTANYKISCSNFNSKHSDFSPIILDDNKVVFVSSRPTAKWILRKHGWTNKRYL